ncbi:hypothetical protein ABPG72_017596 [Tetrahymena utriculariae]
MLQFFSTWHQIFGKKMQKLLLIRNNSNKHHANSNLFPQKVKHVISFRIQKINKINKQNTIMDIYTQIQQQINRYYQMSLIAKSTSILLNAKVKQIIDQLINQQINQSIKNQLNKYIFINNYQPIYEKMFFSIQLSQIINLSNTHPLACVRKQSSEPFLQSHKFLNNLFICSLVIFITSKSRHSFNHSIIQFTHETVRSNWYENSYSQFTNYSFYLLDLTKPYEIHNKLFLMIGNQNK